MIPTLTQRERMLEGESLSVADYVAKKPLSRFSESVRSIRVAVQFSTANNPTQLVLITSSTPFEGKSTLTQCLAYSAATGGQRVLVIDCDLRHPSLSRQFGMTDSLGVTDLLLGQATEAQVFVEGPHPNLTVAPAGSLTRHPPDVLGSERLPALLKNMRSRYDLILLDAPPVMPVIDSTLLSRVVDKIIFVVNWRSTPRDVVARAINALGEPRSKIAGIALNNVQVASASSYSSAYGYYNKHCKAYYEE
jgi:capsular exopolysaccharide synthesis family protein